MPKLVDKAEQRRLIREAARRTFARRGIAGTGLTHVAVEAGMGRSSLYHYYGDKAALVRDLARELLDEEEKLFAAAAGAEGSPRERFERLMFTLASSFEYWQQYGRMMLQLWATEVRRFRPYFARIRTHLAELIEQGQSCGEFSSEIDPRLTASSVIALLDGMLVQYYLDPAAFADAAALTAALCESTKRMVER